MTALFAEPVILGYPRPRILSLPPTVVSYDQAVEAIELAESAGLFLDEWQSWSLTESMGTGSDGLWSAFEVCWIISRQNGKNAVLRVRELYGLFLGGEELIIHTAHEFKASTEHFRKMMQMIKNTPSLHKRVKPNGYKTSHGEEAIELRASPTLIFGSDGRLVRQSIEPRLRFLARSRGSGRSFTCDTLVYDEAMILSDAEVGASLPTLSAVRNPQVWYTASAGMPDSTQLNSVRNRGIAGDDPELVFGEWSANPHNEYCPPGCSEHDDRDNPETWAKANPALGRTRLTLAHTRREFRKMPAAQFDRERLGIGEWPMGAEAWLVIPESVWDKCAVGGRDENGTWTADIGRPARIAVAVDVTPDQSAACIAIAGITKDAAGQERILVEIGLDPQGTIDHRAGTAWVIPRLKELKLRHRLAAVVIDPIGPGLILADAAEKAGLEVTRPKLRDVAEAHMQFCNWARDLPERTENGKVQAAQPRKLAHLAQRDLRSAVSAGVRRDLGDGQYAWARKSTTVDISPVCAASFAAWAANKFGRGYDILKSIA